MLSLPALSTTVLIQANVYWLLFTMAASVVGCFMAGYMSAWRHRRTLRDVKYILLPADLPSIRDTLSAFSQPRD